MLKYKREGLAETTWKQGLIVRAAYSRNSFPKNPREIFLDMYEETYKKKKVPIPDWLREDYEKSSYAFCNYICYSYRVCYGGKYF